MDKGKEKRVLIASANPLFGRGLEKMILSRWGGQNTSIRLTKTTAETLAMVEAWQPDLVLIDYDDKTISRAEFMRQFGVDDRPMQVMLVSLQASGAVVVYDRRTLTPAQAQDWLNLAGSSSEELPATSPPRSGFSMKHLSIAGVLVLVSTILVYLLLSNIGLLPVEASVQARPIDRLFNFHYWVIAFLFSLIVVFIAYSLIVFRRRNEDDSDGQYFKGNNPLEITWTIIPLGFVIFLSYLGSVTLADTRKAEPQPLEIKVTAGQWFWRFEYPEYGIVSDKMMMPVNTQALLKLTSLDVIHSFWVPEFRVKQDLLPGENFVRELRITPNKIGEYKVRCAELCGTSHAYMESPVIVVSQADFDAWVQEELNLLGADPAARGEKWARNNGCLSCHSLDGSVSVGPTWKGLYGATQQLADGSMATVDDAYLLNAIIKPNAQVAAGFPANVMPQNFLDTLSEQQLADIIAFIKTLK
jgi:cytochrome c oxidase subunit 2